jgi:hypothetical protein
MSRPDLSRIALDPIQWYCRKAEAKEAGYAAVGVSR